MMITERLLVPKSIRPIPIKSLPKGRNESSKLIHDLCLIWGAMLIFGHSLIIIKNHVVSKADQLRLYQFLLG